MRGAARFRKMETGRAFLGWPLPETGTHRLAGTAGVARSGPTVDGGGGLMTTLVVDRPYCDPSDFLSPDVHTPV